MAAKKKSVLAQRVNELEDAVTRMFTGEAPAPKPPSAGRPSARLQEGGKEAGPQGEKGREEGGRARRSRKAKRKARR